MKLLIGILLLLTGCAGQTITPEQAQAYANVAHSVTSNAIQDYKTIHPLINK